MRGTERDVFGDEAAHHAHHATMRLAGVAPPAWRDALTDRGLGGGTIRHRLASLASLFEYLCERNAVTHNPIKASNGPVTRRMQEAGPDRETHVDDLVGDLLLHDQPRGVSSTHDRSGRDRSNRRTALDRIAMR